MVSDVGFRAMHRNAYATGVGAEQTVNAKLEIVSFWSKRDEFGWHLSCHPKF